MNFSAGIGLILMHPRHAAVACLLGALSSAKLSSAEPLPEPATRDVKNESLRLIHQDIRAREEARPAKPISNASDTASGEVLDLPLIMVKEKKPTPLPPPPPKELKLEEFFRTGTIWESHPGGVKLWMKGDKGLMLTFPF